MKICAIPLDDEVELIFDHIGPIREDDEYGGFRIAIIARYASINTPWRKTFWRCQSSAWVLRIIYYRAPFGSQHANAAKGEAVIVGPHDRLAKTWSRTAGCYVS